MFERLPEHAKGLLCASFVVSMGFVFGFATNTSDSLHGSYARISNGRTCSGVNIIVYSYPIKYTFILLR